MWWLYGDRRHHTRIDHTSNDNYDEHDHHHHDRNDDNGAPRADGWASGGC